MAVYECDFSRHRYPQPQQTMYFTHVIGRVADTYKMRLCPEHFGESRVIVQQALADLDEETQSSITCDKCGADRAGSLFAKVFPLKGEMVQYVGDFCANCLSTLGNQLRIFNGDHFTAP